MHATWLRNARRGATLILLTASLAVLPGFSTIGSTANGTEPSSSDPIVSLTSAEWSATMASRFRMYYPQAPAEPTPSAEQTAAESAPVQTEAAGFTAAESNTQAAPATTEKAATAKAATQTSTKSATQPAATTAANTAAAPASEPAQPAPAAQSTADEQAEAQAILDGYIAKYPILAGTTVKFGDAKGRQAICYYQSGRIVISPTHTASLRAIISHEIGHVIDWRDNGVMDWGESIPAL